MVLKDGEGCVNGVDLKLSQQNSILDIYSVISLFFPSRFFSLKRDELEEPVCGGCMKRGRWVECITATQPTIAVTISTEVIFEECLWHPLF